jgi:hypothetical protein
VDAKPEVLNHNTESVPRLYRVVRSGARYERTLRLLEYAKELNPAGITKSGVMVGLGEETSELLEVFRDLAAVTATFSPSASICALRAIICPWRASTRPRSSRSQDRGAEDGLPACGVGAAGAVQLPCA